jgi:NaMN:DMB phosphoribosyltransferase
VATATTPEVPFKTPVKDVARVVVPVTVKVVNEPVPPLTKASAYALVTASVDKVGVAKLTILLLFKFKLPDIDV